MARQLTAGGGGGGEGPEEGPARAPVGGQGRRIGGTPGCPPASPGRILPHSANYGRPPADQISITATSAGCVLHTPAPIGYELSDLYGTSP